MYGKRVPYEKSYDSKFGQSTNVKLLVPGYFPKSFWIPNFLFKLHDEGSYRQEITIDYDFFADKIQPYLIRQF